MNSGIDSILEEILPSIFKHLRIRDRKHVRLTCSLWYHECSRFSMTKNEKFIFRKRKSPDMVRGSEEFFQADFFQRCERWRNHWEFHGLPLPCLPFPWESRGVLVKVLFIYNCTIDELTFAKIIFHCTNLIRFRLVSDSPHRWAPSAEYLFGASNFDTPRIDRLVKTGIKREKLTSFEVYLCMEAENVISRAMYQKIFKICPNIRTFGHSDGTFYSQRFTLVDDHPNLLGEWPFPPDKRTLESWTLPISKFTEFRTLFFDQSRYRADFLDFLRYQTDLERIYLDVVEKGSNSERTPILFHALRSLPKLRELWYNGGITVGDGISLTPEEFCEILRGTSNLEALQFKYIYLCLKLPIPDTQYLVPSVKYTKLKKLILGPTVDEIIVFEILNRCSTSLHSLHVDSLISGRTITKIFEIHTDLQNLYIRGFKKLSSSSLALINWGALSGQEMHEFSFARLRNLEYLEIKCISSPDMRVLLRGLNSPNLLCYCFPEDFEFSSKSPHIRREERYHILDQTLRTLAQKAPRLEVLCFYGMIPMSATELVEYCKPLRKLEVIFLTGAVRFYLKRWIARNSSSVEALFTECPALCWLADDHKSMYSYDHSTRTLIEHGDSVRLFDQKYSMWSF